MATRNEDKRDKDQENIESVDEKGRSEGIKNDQEGDTTMLFASEWGMGMGMMNIIGIHRASKFKTIRYQKNDKEKDERLLEWLSWVWKFGILDVMTSQ